MGKGIGQANGLWPLKGILRRNKDIREKTSDILGTCGAWGIVTRQCWLISHVKRMAMEGVNYKGNRGEGCRDFTIFAAVM